MSKVFQFGEDVEGFNIRVLNEREIRAAAGILFLMMLISILTVIMKGDFTMLKYAVIIFLTDISVRVFVNPKYAPTLIIGRWIVRNQVPEYVGAPQKKFAWIIGFVLAIAMFVLLVLVNSYSPITGLICLSVSFFCFLKHLLEFAWAVSFTRFFLKTKCNIAPVRFVK